MRTHRHDPTARSTPLRPLRWVAACLAATLLAACGGGEEATSGAESATASDDAPAGPRVTVTLGDETMEFTGGRCYVTESGGSMGAVSISKAVTADGAELGIDWAGDSPNSSMVRIDLPDGTQLEASSFGAVADAFEVSVSGSTATVRTTVRSLFEPDAAPRDAVLEVRCR